MNAEQLGFRARYEHLLSLEDASSIFSKYYEVAPEILGELSVMARALQIGAHTLGVHYRGTDKEVETGRVTWHTFIEAVQETISENPHIRNILLSSDEPEFLAFFHQQIWTLQIIEVPSLLLSRNGKPPHYSGHDGLAVGREALLTCLLLSQCGLLLKTPSFLSAWSKIFNPALSVQIILSAGRHPTYFPDSHIWAAQERLGANFLRRRKPLYKPSMLSTPR
jgi:hypothetical protein